MAKIAVFAPMPKARVSTANKVKAGLFLSVRMPYSKSCHNFVIDLGPTSESALVTLERERRARMLYIIIVTVSLRIVDTDVSQLPYVGF